MSGVRIKTRLFLHHLQEWGQVRSQLAYVHGKSHGIEKKVSEATCKSKITGREPSEYTLIDVGEENR